ncbi:MAG: integrase domain-containing protein [Nevskia sp.]|nr:integrase domain-containing protein [Nevskia sp.]
MSRKTELEADLKRVGFQLGGASLTRQARTATFQTFAKTMHDLKYGIQRASQIGGRHLKAFVAARMAKGVSTGTLANEASHLRAVLEQVGKQGLARNPEYSNKALGIEQRSRIGTKLPLSDPAFNAFKDKMETSGRSGTGATLELQRHLGARAAEAIRAGQADTLSRWERELKESGFVRVIEGTKGGRPRDVHPANPDRALAAIQAAQAVLQTTGQPHLVVRDDGTPAASLKQAMNIYRNICHREGIQSHSARYAFAQERAAAYMAQGLSEREARAATSLDLGHGDGRGRYVASVYVRGD